MKRRRKNPLPKVTPERWAIYSKSGKTRTHYQRVGTGKYATHSFTVKGKAYKFGSQKEAVDVATSLIDRWPGLKQTRVTVERLPGVRANPLGFRSAAESYARSLDSAAEAYEGFAGKRATKETKVNLPSARTGFELGKLVGVVYESNRAGEGRIINYHEFQKSSRPHLVASNGGALLEIVGGRYEVTDHGIEDR